MQKKESVLLKQKIDYAHEDGLTQLEIPAVEFGESITGDSVIVYPAQITALIQSSRYYLAKSIFKIHFMGLYNDVKQFNRNELDTRKIDTFQDETTGTGYQIDPTMPLSLFLCQSFALSQPTLVFSNEKEQTVKNPFPIVILNSGSINFNSEPIKDYCFGAKGQSYSEEKSEQLLREFFTHFLERDLKFCQTLGIDSVCLTSSSFYHFKHNDESQRRILERAYWKSLDLLAKKYHAITLYVSLSNYLSSTLKSSNENLITHTSAAHVKALKLGVENAGPNNAKQKRIALQNPVDISSLILSTHISEQEPSNVVTQRVIDFSLGLIADSAILSDSTIVAFEDNERINNKAKLAFNAALTPEFSILFSVMQDSHGEDPFGILAKGRANYRKVQTIKLEYIADFIISYPHYAKFFFKARKFAIGQIPFGIANLRDFRRELCGRPDLLDKLIKSNSRTILTVMREERILNSSSLNEKDRRRLVANVFFSFTTQHDLFSQENEAFLKERSQELESFRLTVDEWLQLISEYLDNKNNSSKKSFFYLFRHSKQAATVFLPFLKSFLNQIAYRSLVRKALSQGILISDELLDMFFPRNEKIVLVVLAIVKSEVIENDSTKLLSEMVAVLRKLNLTGKELYQILDAAIEENWGVAERIGLFSLFEYFSETNDAYIFKLRSYLKGRIEEGHSVNSLIEKLYFSGFILGELLILYQETKSETRAQLFFDSLKKIEDDGFFCNYKDRKLFRPTVSDAITSLVLTGEDWLNILNQSDQSGLNKLCVIILEHSFALDSIRYALIKDPNKLALLRNVLARNIVANGPQFFKNLLKFDKENSFSKYLLKQFFAISNSQFDQPSESIDEIGDVPVDTLTKKNEATVTPTVDKANQLPPISIHTLIEIIGKSLKQNRYNTIILYMSGQNWCNLIMAYFDHCEKIKNDLKTRCDYLVRINTPVKMVIKDPLDAEATALINAKLRPQYHRLFELLAQHPDYIEKIKWYLTQQSGDFLKKFIHILFSNGIMIAEFLSLATQQDAQKDREFKVNLFISGIISLGLKHLYKRMSSLELCLEYLDLTTDEWLHIIDALKTFTDPSDIDKFFSLLTVNEREADKVRILMIQDPKFIDSLLELDKKYKNEHFNYHSQISYLILFLTSILAAPSSNYFRFKIAGDFYQRSICDILDLPDIVQALHSKSIQLQRKLISRLESDGQELLKVALKLLSCNYKPSDFFLPKLMIANYNIMSHSNEVLMKLMDIIKVVYGESFVLLLSKTAHSEQLTLSTLYDMAKKLDLLRAALLKIEEHSKKNLANETIVISNDQWQEVNDFVKLKFACPKNINLQTYLTEKVTYYRSQISLTARSKAMGVLFNSQSTDNVDLDSNPNPEKSFK